MFNYEFNCNLGCSSNEVKFIPTELMLLIWYSLFEKINSENIINEDRVRPFLCKQIINNRKFCNKLTNAWVNHYRFIITNKRALLRVASKLEKQNLPSFLMLKAFDRIENNVFL